MSNIVNKNISNMGSLLDVASFKFTEFAVDETSQRLGFNSTWISGILKVGGAFASDMLASQIGLGKVAKTINGGLLADGMTDIYVDVRKKWNSTSVPVNQSSVRIV